MKVAVTAVEPEPAGVGLVSVPILFKLVPPSGVVPYSNPLTQFFVRLNVHGTSTV